jgi:hypothetical protein
MTTPGYRSACVESQVKQTGSDEERGPVFLNESEELELNGAP